MDESKEQWNSGEPPTQGWYDCRLPDGEELPLRWWICQMNHRKRYWKDIKGVTRGFSSDVEWTGEVRASAW